MSFRRHSVVALTLASACLFPAGAGAAGWSAPTTVYADASDTYVPEAPSIVSDASGTLTALWVAAGPGGSSVLSATKPVGGSWSTPVAVVADASQILDATLAVSSNGHAVAAWTERRQDRWNALVASTRTPAGTWSTPAEARPRPVGPLGYTGVFSAGVAPSGAALTASTRRFVESLGFAVRGQELTVNDKAPGGSWALGPNWKATGTLPTTVQVGVDDAGNATLLFDEDGGLKSATRPAGGVWPEPQTIAPPQTPEDSEPGVEVLGAVSEPKLAVNAAGTAVVTWKRKVGDDLFIQAIHRGGGFWGPIENLINGGDSIISGLEVAIDPSGRSTAVWDLASGPDTPEAERASQPQTSTRRVGRPWTLFDGLTSAVPAAQGGVGGVALGVGGTDQAVAAWVRSTTGATLGLSLEAAVRTSGATWASSEKISDVPSVSGIEPAAGVAPNGEATVIWFEGTTLKSSSLGGATPTPTPTPTPTATPSPSPSPAPSAAPSISSVGGFAYGWLGGIAIINGKNFTDVTAVKFGDKPATTGFAVGTGVLVVVAPPQDAGSYAVSVETKDGVATAPTPFTYRRLF